MWSGQYGFTITYKGGVSSASATGNNVWLTLTQILSVTNPGTQNSAVGDTVSLTIQAHGLPTGKSWTFSASNCQPA